MLLLFYKKTVLPTYYSILMLLLHKNTEFRCYFNLHLQLIDCSK